MLCFKMENVTASIIYGGVSQFILIDGQWNVNVRGCLRAH